MDTMIGRIEATPGNRDELADALVHGVDDMPGCLTYLVAVDPEDATGVWIAEAWASHEAHEAWLASDATRALVDRIRHLMVGYEQRHELRAVGGLASVFGPTRSAG
jgi:quinol monooxygenase YgiN